MASATPSAALQVPNQNFTYDDILTKFDKLTIYQDQINTRMTERGVKSHSIIESYKVRLLDENVQPHERVRLFLGLKKFLGNLHNQFMSGTAATFQLFKVSLFCRYQGQSIEVWSESLSLNNLHICNANLAGWHFDDVNVQGTRFEHCCHDEGTEDDTQCSVEPILPQHENATLKAPSPRSRRSYESVVPISFAPNSPRSPRFKIASDDKLFEKANSPFQDETAADAVQPLSGGDTESKGASAKRKISNPISICSNGESSIPRLVVTEDEGGRTQRGLTLRSTSSADSGLPSSEQSAWILNELSSLGTTPSSRASSFTTSSTTSLENLTNDSLSSSQDSCSAVSVERTDEKKVMLMKFVDEVTSEIADKRKRGIGISRSCKTSYGKEIKDKMPLLASETIEDAKFANAFLRIKHILKQFSVQTSGIDFYKLLTVVRSDIHDRILVFKVDFTIIDSRQGWVVERHIHQKELTAEQYKKIVQEVGEPRRAVKKK
ncbi:MAG: hypothetical protein ACPGUD_11935 [Parashewanella sp.]